MLFLFLILLIIVRLRIPDVKVSKINYGSEVIPEISTGDLIAIGSNRWIGHLSKIIIGSKWSHIGLIISDRDGNPLVAEAGYDFTKKGIYLMPLKEWLQLYQKKRFLWSKHQGPPICRKKLLRLHQSQSSKGFDIFVKNWFRSQLSSKYVPQEHNSFFCSEYIAFLLQQINVIKREKIPGYYTPRALIEGSFPVHSGHQYLEPVIVSVRN